MLAASGDPRQSYREIIRSLKRSPLVIRDPESGDRFELTYATLVGVLLGDLYGPEAGLFVDLDLSFVLELLRAPAERRGAAQTERARSWLVERLRAQQAEREAAANTRAQQAKAFGYAFPYDNSIEATLSVLCTDGLNPVEARRWRGYADAADRRAPDFGRLWAWNSAPCARRTWTARDEDRYRGPFTRRTGNPVLVVGNYWDPATNYFGAVRVARLLPNSRLLSSDNWGHTAYGTSACVTRAINRYLLYKTLPDRGTVCEGAVQPFTEPLPGPEPGPPPARVADPNRGLPPVVPPVPGAVPRT